MEIARFVRRLLQGDKTAGNTAEAGKTVGIPCDLTIIADEESEGFHIMEFPSALGHIDWFPS